MIGENNEIYVVGGGIAGLSAGIYLSRAGKYKPVIFEKTSPGGLATLAGRIENFPGFPGGIDGIELAKRAQEQFVMLGGKLLFEEIKSITRSGEHFILSGKQEYTTKGFILATGTSPKKLGIPGEKELVGKGVSYCGVCDAPFFRDKIVAVIGGGNTAIQEAIHLADFAQRIYIIHRRTSFRAFDHLVSRAKNNPKIIFLLNSNATAILGDNKVEAIEIEYLESYEKKVINVDGVFIFVGSDPNTGLIKFDFQRDEQGYVITNNWAMSSVRGMFAAGDIRSKVLRQIVTAAADGAVAAIGLHKFLQGEI